MASSSSGFHSKYEVFINFRGEDTRRGFVSHLYKALRQKPINTFIDSEELRKGDRLSELLAAIRESRLSIVVFSRKYASSTWCLKELVEILECKDTKSQIVLPIFYEVDPSDIRNLKGSFAKAFAKHERHSNVDVKEVQSWRSALARATDLSGWDSKNFKDDAELIEKIVEDVFRKLIHIASPSSQDNGLVEMGYHMREMHLLLYPPGVETNDVRIVGIWGMGGLGKTTIARAVYDEIACRFEACCCCFIENVKEGFMKHDRLHMQAQLLSCISGNKVGSSDIMDKGFQVLLKRLGQRKVLLVVDDVDNLAQIEDLLGKQHSFGGGSRIIITTRDVNLLSRADAKYNPKFLSNPGALELFKRYAFKTNQPTSDYDNLSRLVIQYAEGLPLALKVLGAFLYGKTVCEWEDGLKYIRKIQQRGIHDVLKTSFDRLDDTQQDIFLDIACFFKGMDKDYAIEILDSCGFNPHIGIRVLIDRALITVSSGGTLEMHDSLVEMGRQIVRQKSIKEPGRRSRLWSYEDIHCVLTQNTGTEAIESINLRLSVLHEGGLNAEAFVRMTRLRLLKISCPFHNLHLNGHLKFLSRELRCLSWHRFPLKSLASNCQFENLVDLDMRFSLIDRLWDGTQYGETPLHMAAKNGCNDAARLLLVHGAFIEAKENNGMTPLHLAVWYSLTAEEFSTVKTLLEYNADCSAKDDEGMTPIHHLSKGRANGKLRELLQWHYEEQRRKKAIEACSETKAKMDELESELSNIVGLHELKVQLRKWAKGMLLDERRKALGLKVGVRRPPHMAFLGNPGTGKTMVARILGRLLHMVGILPTDKVTEVQRTDLVGEFVGHTGPKTRRKIKDAEGGILFVDEAYRLIPMQKADDKDYGLEALEEIMSVMDSGKIVVIFAGYSEPMKRVIASNEGFCRRVTKFFNFSDFTSEDLAKILHIKMHNQTEESLLYGFQLHSSCSIEAVADLIRRETTEKQCKEMNGGLVDTRSVIWNALEISISVAAQISQVNFDIGHADIFLVNHKLILCFFIFSVIILVASLGVIKF